MSYNAIKLLDWSARASGLESKETFQHWLHASIPREIDETYKPACLGVSPRLRGKSSVLARLVMEPFFEVVSACDLAPNVVDLVFASKYGEIQVLERLFESMAEQQTLSPLDFCNSVHHTSTGYLSIAAKNRQISRTVSAGERSFLAALTEAYCLLTTQKSETVVVLVADERVPNVFPLSKPSFFSHGAALVFKGTNDASPGGIGAKELSQLQREPVQLFDWLRTISEEESAI